MNRLLITRPEADARRLAKKLSPLGYECLIEPMLVIETVPEEAKKLALLLENKPQAIVLTSKHALEAFDSVKAFAHIPTFASGARTGEYARRIGMKNVTVTGETVSGLADYLATHLPSGNGAIIYLSGEDITTDLASVLPEFRIDRLITYRAIQTRAFSPSASSALTTGTLDGVVLFTRRSAEAFLNCMNEIGQPIDLKKMTAYCLSESVAEALDKSAFGHILSAERPTEQGMLDLITRKNRCKDDKNSYNKDMSDNEPILPSPKAAPTTRARAGWVWVFAFLFILQLSATAFLTYPLILHHLASFGVIAQADGEADDIDASSMSAEMEHQIMSLQSRVDDLEHAMDQQSRQIAQWSSEIPSQHTPTDEESDSQADVTTDMAVESVTTLLTKMDELNTRLSKLEEASISDQKIKELLTIRSDIESLYASVETKQKNQWKHIQLLTAYDAMQKAITNGEAYTNALNAFSLASQDMADAQEWLHSLRPYQESGIATVAQLQQSFKQAIQTYWRATSADGDSKWADIKRNLSDLVVVRKVGEEHSGQDDASIIARAEARLAKGSVAEATAELQQISSTALPSFENWLSDAQTRLNILATLNTIRQSVLQTISAENG